MAQYHFIKPNRTGRRVEIRKGGIHISVVALIGSFLLACLVWLYMEGYDLRHGAPETGGTTETEASLCVEDSGDSMLGDTL